MISEELKLSTEFQQNLLKYRSVVYYYDGMSISKIAEMIGKDKTTISKWIKKFADYGNVLEKIPKSGRKSKVNEEIKDLLIESMKSNNELQQKEL